ncbi:hypothetical protein LTR53_016991 [Teratosphaeriaceae sp. CCFEE 6253]|nr:hypothetical protein LTR53_016991 [Teratosphaeriaceae sp. CCFEE 6253]
MSSSGTTKKKKVKLTSSFSIDSEYIRHKSTNLSTGEWKEIHLKEPHLITGKVTTVSDPTTKQTKTTVVGTAVAKPRPHPHEKAEDNDDESQL